MTKENILSEIRRIANESGGKVGLRAFVAASGIPEKRFLGKYWATWNEAVGEAGIATSIFSQPRTEVSSVIAAFAALVERLEKWPTEIEMTLERRRNSSFPSMTVFRRLAKETSLASRLVEYCAVHESLSAAAQISNERVEAEKGEPIFPGRAPISGYVYMMRSGRRYKIGHTNSPTRRHREVRLDLPDPTSLVHSIETDDPPGIEAYWHRRFGSKRIRDTEFFTLDATDIAAFKRRKSQ